VFLSTFSTQNNIGLATYLYTNSKQDNSAFKCEGGWQMAVCRQLAACSWWLVAGGWWLQVVVGDCLS
jgi:hypothetical protein